jgi:hypothetical protein
MSVRTGFHFCAGAKGPGLFVVCVAHLLNVMVCYYDVGDDKHMTDVV